MAIASIVVKAGTELGLELAAQEPISGSFESLDDLSEPSLDGDIAPEYALVAHTVSL